MLELKTVITKKYKHLLWVDECRDQFLLTNWCEVFQYSEEKLGVTVFNIVNLHRLTRNIPISGLFKTDDDLATFYIDRRNLPRILALKAPKIRMHAKGTKIKRLEKKLGHKIYPFNPKLGENG